MHFPSPLIARDQAPGAGPFEAPFCAEMDLFRGRIRNSQHLLSMGLTLRGLSWFSSTPSNQESPSPFSSSSYKRCQIDLFNWERGRGGRESSRQAKQKKGLPPAGRVSFPHQPFSHLTESESLPLPPPGGSKGWLRTLPEEEDRASLHMPTRRKQEYLQGGLKTRNLPH